MEIDVVIPTVDSARRLPEVIRRAKEFIRPERIVVIDGGSKDDTQGVAERSGCEVLVDKKSLGSSRMTGIRASSSEIIAFIDDDIYVGEGFREKMLGFLDQSTGAVQGVAILTDPALRSRGMEISKARFAGRAFIELKSNERGYTNATLVRRGLLTDLDISDMNAYEDMVIARHVLSKGFSWKVVPVFVDHDHTGRPTFSKSAWNYAGLLNLARTGRMTKMEALRSFVKFASSHPIEMANALASSDVDRFTFQLRLLLGALASPFYLVRSGSARRSTEPHGQTEGR